MCMPLHFCQTDANIVLISTTVLYCYINKSRVYSGKRVFLSLDIEHCFYLERRHHHASKSRKTYRHNVPTAKQSRICSRRLYSSFYRFSCLTPPEITRWQSTDSFYFRPRYSASRWWKFVSRCSGINRAEVKKAIIR